MSLKFGLRIRTTVAHVILGAALSASLAIAVTLLLEEMEERFLQGNCSPGVCISLENP